MLNSRNIIRLLLWWSYQSVLIKTLINLRNRTPKSSRYIRKCNLSVQNNTRHVGNGKPLTFLFNSDRRVSPHVRRFGRSLPVPTWRVNDHVTHIPTDFHRPTAVHPGTDDAPVPNWNRSREPDAQFHSVPSINWDAFQLSPRYVRLLRNYRRTAKSYARTFGVYDYNIFTYVLRRMICIPTYLYSPLMS